MDRSSSPQPPNPNPDRHDELMQWWFGDEPFETDSEAKIKRWFMGGDTVDAEIKARFGDLFEAARSGSLDSWSATAHGTLGLLLLLDQFSRSLHRGTADAFACDPRARELVAQGLDQGHDQALGPIERCFFYMPLMHSESLEDHDRAIALFEALVASQPEQTRDAYAVFLSYSHQHRDTIVRFGRYPHRNHILGRTSTPQEKAYLDGGAATYGQK